VKLNIIGRPVIPADQMYRNIACAKSLGFPSVKDRQGTKSGPLAVVGGGPSVLGYIDEIRGYGQNIWAINGTCSWLRNYGIDSVFFSCDALPQVVGQARGAKRAVIATQCDPEVFRALKDVDVTVFDATHGEIIGSGSTTATATPMTAAIMGYRPIVFYGCESSYPENRTHAYIHEARDFEMIVKVNGQSYRTAPDFCKQAEELSALFRLERESGVQGNPVFMERSGGLLRAMIEHGDDYELEWVSHELVQNINVSMKYDWVLS
jgi:hypothetical protein